MIGKNGVSPAAKK
ncbi:hypothetical protein Patl1_06225 [Pistacia atlantica]|uniref:Uncharacterized protein n=2 Tax=Sapindales TaxID=41937 RepID=A0ACC1BRV0_9ROSI|nr:hypothetical protein Patl1_06225 [Pistacia atlantica]